MKKKDTILKFICVGRILGAHGVKGHLKIESFTEKPKDLFTYGPLFKENGELFPTITLKSMSGDFFITEMSGISNREEATFLRGDKLFIPRNVLPRPKAGEYYEAEIIGLGVVDERGKDFGLVLAIHDHGAGAFLEIGTSKKDSFMLPFKDAFVPEVNFGAGSIVIKVPEGWP